MDFQYLDLDEHEPEEFSGKLIKWFGRDYLVGRHIGTGAERIVHQLIDRDTGEVGFVIKFFRQPQLESNWKQPNDGKFYLHIHLLLACAILEIPGGAVEIMPKLDSARIGHPSKIEGLERASKFVREENWADAQKEYSKLSQEFQSDPEVSYNLGATLTQLGDPFSALRAFRRSVEVDHFSIEVRLAVTQCAFASGNVDMAEYYLWETLDLFPGNVKIRKVGVSLYRETGRPERAVGLMTASREFFDEHYVDIIHDFEKKKNAEGIVKQAFQEAGGDAKKIPESAIRSALDEYPADPLMQINWALFLRRKGEFEASAAALLEQLPRVSWDVARACILNAAFSKVLAGEHQEAIPLIHQAISMYQTEGKALNWADLNGLGNWVFDIGGFIAWIDDEPSTSLGLIRELQGTLGSEKADDLALLTHLAAVYSHGSEEYAKRSSAESRPPNTPAREDG